MQTVLEKKVRIRDLKREKLRRAYPKLWVAKYHHKTTHFGKLQFDGRFQFLIDMYKDADKYPRSCVRKSVQCGVTDWLVVAAIEEAYRGLRVLYVMPNRDLRNDYVKDRFDVLLKVVPFYREAIRTAVGDSDSVGLKHVNKGLINFAGSKSKADFVSFQADSICVDEVDQCDQSNLEMAPDRMDGSDYKYYRRVGNPSVELWGIDSVYSSESTKGVWIHRCERCGKWQQLDFFKNIVRRSGDVSYDILSGTKEDPAVVCVKCNRSFNRFGKGNWVDRVRTADIKGYFISQLFSANVSIASLVNTFFKAIGNEVRMQLFFNSKLGLPYSSAGSKITFPILQKATEKSNYVITMNNTEKATALQRLYIGIDVGKYFHVIGRQLLNSGIRKLVFVGRIGDTKTIVQLLKIMKPKVMVIDRDPETKKVEDMKKALHKLYSCRFQEGKTLLGLKKKADQFKKEKHFTIDRTFLLDSVKSDFTNGKMLNPVNAKDIGNEDLDDYGEYYQHMLASTRTFIEDRNKFVWRESSADHLFLAEGYCKMAEELDDKILDFYKGKVSEYKGRSLIEVEADLKKKGELVPKKSDGSVDYEKLKVLSAEAFLQRIFAHTEKIIGGNK